MRTEYLKSNDKIEQTVDFVMKLVKDFGNVMEQQEKTFTKVKNNKGV
jgi:hypothetical protein